MQIYHQSRAALGGNATLYLISKLSIEEIDREFIKLWRKIDEFEYSFSRFLPDSELSIFNNQAGTKVLISKEFNELLESSIYYYNETNGLFNPFILPKLQEAGYKNSFSDPNNKANDYSNRSVVDISELKLSNEKAFIPYGTAIDLGGIGKGYLADKLADSIDSNIIQGFWISLGGDIAIGGDNIDNKDWVIEIYHAEKKSEIVAKIIIPSGKRFAVATSGITKRKGINKGVNWHHIIDPRTQLPATTDIETITLVSEKTITADVFATCAVILGENSAEGLLDEQYIQAAFIQYKTHDDKLSFKNIGNLIKLVQ